LRLGSGFRRTLFAQRAYQEAHDEQRRETEEDPSHPAKAPSIF
jgi:hypothetical protein